MLENNNQKVITAMAIRVMKRNKRRYVILIIAVMLAVFMVFATLTVGETYFKLNRQQELHTKGADFNAVLGGGVLDGQKEICENFPGVLSAGITAYSGYVTAAKTDDTARAALVWCDEVYWEQQKKPALEWVEGEYPQKENELMVNADIMEKYGLGELEIGDSFELSYFDYYGDHTKEFTISGICSEYSENTKLYVSKTFYDATGHQLEYDGMLCLKFKSPFIGQKTLDPLEKSVKLATRQKLTVAVDTEKLVGVLVGLGGLILFTCLSAYLLIYNILYLSVSGNIRYYGLLQTVGMTEEQIRCFWKKQMLFTGITGITGGILLGMVVSFFVLPGVVKAFGIREKSIEVSFHPLVLLLSIAVAGLTVYLGSQKAVKIAAAVTPVEALGYRSYKKAKRTESRRGKYGKKLLWRMAFGQIKKDKKKSVVVMLSLAAALSVILCVTTLIKSNGARTLFSNFMDTDLEIRNDTLYNDEDMWKQIIDESFIRALEANEGVAEIHLLLGAKMVVPWEPEFSDMWMREYFDEWMYYTPYDEIVDEYKQNPEKYYSFVKGIGEKEFEYISSTLETPVSKEEFEEGKTCLLYRDVLSFDMDTLKDKKVKYYITGEEETIYQMQIGGLVEANYYEGIRGYGPIVIVSDSFLKKIVEEPYICKAAINYKQEFDEETENMIMESINGSPYAKDFSYDSKLKGMKKLKKTQGNMRGVGIGITLILVIIGFMNYVNTVFANIQNCQMSLAVMESVGMTGRQLKGMLAREGIILASGALLITATAGVAVTYICYQSMNYMKVPFEVPILPVAVAAAVNFLLCAAIPPLSYYIIAGRESLIERIRGLEQ